MLADPKRDGASGNEVTSPCFKEKEGFSLACASRVAIIMPYDTGSIRRKLLKREIEEERENGGKKGRKNPLVMG